MPNLASSVTPLSSLSALGNFSKDMNGISVSEVLDLGIVSIAIPSDTRDALSDVIHQHFSVALPTIGKFTQSDTSNARFLGLQQDQLFMLFDYDGDRATEEVSAKVNASEQLAYLSDQSDSWVTLRISGNNCREALERICPLDIHPAAFPVGSVARTSMEHMAVIILRESEDSYLLLSLRSFAQSFLQAVTTSIENVS